MNGKKIKTIDMLYITTADGEKLNVGGGNVQLVLDGKQLDLSKIEIQVTPIIKNRSQGPRKPASTTGSTKAAK